MHAPCHNAPHTPPAMHAPPVDRILDTRLWKHYLAATSLRTVNMKRNKYHTREGIITMVARTGVVRDLYGKLQELCGMSMAEVPSTLIRVPGFPLFDFYFCMVVSCNLYTSISIWVNQIIFACSTSPQWRQMKAEKSFIWKKFHIKSTMHNKWATHSKTCHKFYVTSSMTCFASIWMSETLITRSSSDKTGTGLTPTKIILS